MSRNTDFGTGKLVGGREGGMGREQDMVCNLGYNLGCNLIMVCNLGNHHYPGIQLAAQTFLSLPHHEWNVFLFPFFPYLSEIEPYFNAPSFTSKAEWTCQPCKIGMETSPSEHLGLVGRLNPWGLQLKWPQHKSQNALWQIPWRAPAVIHHWSRWTSGLTLA